MSDDLTTWQRVTVITVTYNSGSVIEACLRSVAGAAGVLVVDNASTDDTAARVGSVAPRAVLERNRANRGFGPANNQGFRNAKSEFVLFLNPDAVLQPGAIAALVAAADRYPQTALFGPRIEDRQAHPVVSHDADLVHRQAMPPAMRKRNDLLPEGDCSVGFLSGAALLARRSAFAAPPFDEAIFLYYEDDDLCLDVRQRGYQLVHVPTAVVRHLGGAASTPSRATIWLKNWHLAWSRLYFERKHCGGAAARRLGAANLLRYGIKTALHALTLNWAKTRRDAARFAGTLASLAGAPSV
ncbi:MAG: glycosyltransferase family 2 protein [Alphaproteobacteria bacterium]|nr:glycosyltransferase family 2 protein [Alphaproteobacteria bacterium]